MVEPRLMKGTRIELSLHHDENCCGAWFPATVVEEICDDFFMVEFQFLTLRMGNEVWKLRVNVDSLHIRPAPPKDPEGIRFHVSEEVDAFYHSGWWRGMIIKVLNNNKYVVFCKHREEFGEFDQSELRLHRDWVNEIWIQEFQDIQFIPCCHNGLKTVAQKTLLQLGDTAVNSDQSNSSALSTRKEYKSTERSSAQTACETFQIEGVSSKQQLISQSDNTITLNKSSGQDIQHQNSYLMKCSFNFEERSIVSNQDHVAEGEEESDSIQMDPTIENTGLPFVKFSPVWETIESMEVFRSLPQQPHFHPLKNLNEEVREGLAIGHTITFTNVVAKTCKVRLDDPKVVLENKLSALRDLEDFGFNVKPVQARLEELLKVRDKHEEFDQEAKVVEERFVKEKHTAEKLKEKFREIEETLGEWEKKRVWIANEIDMTDSSAAELQRQSTALVETVQYIKHDFDSVVAAPW